ncbi:hypothetical protein TrVFT333_009273 [Trichoderma virens FT-333]|nr:hypothetical protein TrVFT333_009273 [Trichoderma virens FT-333]
MSAKITPPAGIAEYCHQKGQVAQQVRGAWKCVQVSDICGPSEDLSTIHQDHDTGNGSQLSHYIYPFDMWVTKLGGGQLTLYINGKQIQPHGSGLDFLIPAGTHADDVWYKSETGAMIHFYGSCSAYNPCQEGEIHVGQYDTDLVLTIADTETTSEQYTVFIDGVKLGTTHGRLTLGEEKYKRANIHMVDVGSGAAGALRSIANDGFWGSFKIPRGTRKITIVDDSSDFDFAFEYRLDKACVC